MTFSVNGICGWLGEARVTRSPGTLATMEKPLNPQSDSPRLSTDEFAACAPKGWVERNDSGTSVAVSGAPYFSDSEFSDIARSRNPAAAILAAYRAHGSRCLEHVQGAFALAICDSRQGFFAHCHR